MNTPNSDSLSIPSEAENLIKVDCLEKDTLARRVIDIWGQTIVESTVIKEQLELYPLPNDVEEEKIELQIHLIDNSYRVIEITPLKTGRDLIYLFAHSIKCKFPEYFNICKKTTEGYDEWIDLNQTLEEQNIDASTNILFKMKFMQTPHYQIDTVSLELYFTQVNKEVISEKYEVPERVLIYLAAFYMQVLFGNYDNMDHVNREKYFTEIFPSSFIKSIHPNEDIMKRINNVHRQLVNMHADDAMLAYIQISKLLPLFGSTMYLMKQGKIDVKIYINETSFVVTTTKNVLVEWINLSEFYGWGFTDRGLYIKVMKRYSENEDYVRLKMKFTCPEGMAKQALNMLEGYNYLFGVKKEFPEGFQPPLTKPSDYIPPVFKTQKRLQLSKLDTYMDYYRRACAKESVVPCVSLLEKFDSYDVNRTLDKLELRDMGLDFDDSMSILNGFELQQTLEKDSKELCALDITYIDVSFNKISPSFCRLLNYTPNITYLNLSYNEFSKHEAIPLSLLLSNAHNLEEFHYCGNNITDKYAKYLIDKLKGFKNLTTLNLKRNSLKSSICEDIAQLVNGRMHFKKLLLGDNKITDQGIDLLCSKLEEGTCHITKLDVSKNAFSYKGFTTLSHMIASKENVTNLNIGSISLGNNPLSPLLALLPVVKCLDVGKLALGKKGWKNFFEALKESVDLESLYMTEGLEKLGWSSFSETFPECINIMNLKAKHTVFTPSTMRRFAIAMADTKTLRFVDLSHSDFGKCFETLCVALQSNASILELRLTHCKLSDTSMSYIRTLIEVNSTLISLNLEHNIISDEGCEEISSTLVENTSLQTLSLRYNRILGASIDSWMTAVCENVSMETLDLRENGIILDVDIKKHLSNLPSFCTILI